jgi:MFS family permease
VTSLRVGADADRARTGVALVFVLNGLCFASLVSRFPDVRADLALSNGGLGLLLLSIAAGSVLALPSSGWLIDRWSAATVVRVGALLVAVGLVVAALGTAPAASVPAVAVGLFINGVGTGVWDVAMNVEGAAVERELGRSIMPRFHAAWSGGSILGATLGVPINALDLPLVVHLGTVGGISCAAAWWAAAGFLPAHPPHGGPSALVAWREPRTLAIGLMVLAFALTEGVANDWLALALIDGYGAPDWLGVAGFALFVISMTTGRLVGTVLLDRFGRVPVLVTTAASAVLGLLLVVYGDHPVLVAVGVVIWGLGASLGFPVGMSAAADEPARAAARVSVVATMGYIAFLGGPPLVGFVGDRVGTLAALLVAAVVLVPSALAIPAARKPADASPAPDVGPRPSH